MSLVDGPFRHLKGRWRFEPIADDVYRFLIKHTAA